MGYFGLFLIYKLLNFSFRIFVPEKSAHVLNLSHGALVAKFRRMGEIFCKRRFCVFGIVGAKRAHVIAHLLQQSYRVEKNGVNSSFEVVVFIDFKYFH